MLRDNVEVPRVLEKCCTAIRDSGALDSVGIYRIGGIVSKIQKLKAAFDKGLLHTHFSSNMPDSHMQL